jgi:hypothetical protein
VVCGTLWRNGEGLGQIEDEDNARKEDVQHKQNVEQLLVARQGLRETGPEQDQEGIGKHVDSKLKYGKKLKVNER